MRRVLSEENLAGSQEIINLNEFGMGVHGNNYKLHDGFQVVVQGDNGGYHFIRRISTQNRQNKGYRNGPYIHPRHQRVVRVDSFKSAL